MRIWARGKLHKTIKKREWKSQEVTEDDKSKVKWSKERKKKKDERNEKK